MKQSRHISATSILAISIALSFAGNAQEAELDDDDVAFVLEEITVTSRRRQESLQDVPVAVSAFRAEDFERYQTNSMLDLSGKVPNLFLKQNPTTTVSTSIYIRGVGQDESHFTSENGVGVYIDGVFYPRASGSVIELLDFERVEILRGPQGTLFGKNAPAGAISLHSRKPDFAESSVRGSVTAGAYNQLEGNLFTNIPLSDNLAVRLDFGARSQDGYVDEQNSGTTVNGHDKMAARVRFLWAPSDDIEVNLILDKSRDRSDIYAPTFVVGRTPVVPLFETFVEDEFNRPQRFDGNGINLTVDWNHSDTLAFKSISAVRWFDHDLWGELIGIPEVPIGLFRDQEQWQASQEFQLNLTLDNFEGVLGAIYFFENNKEEAFNQFAGGGNLYPINDQDSTSLAAFAEGTYEFNEAFSLTAGVRIGYDKKSIDRISTDEPGGVGQTVAYEVQGLEESWTEVTPRAILEFRPFEAFNVNSDNELLAYVSFSEGYKAGAFDPTFTGGQAQAEFIFDPERVTAYEAGLKGEFWDRRIIANFAYYFNDYQDFQIANCTFGANSVCTPANFDVELQGIELEVTARPTAELTLFGSVATISDTIKSPEFSDRDLENTPDVTYFLSAEYRKPVGNDFVLTLGANWQWTDNFFHDLPNGAEAETDAYGLLNAHVAVGPEDGRWELRVFGQNLTDETYILNALSGGAWWLGRPITGGVRLSFQL